MEAVGLPSVKIHWKHGLFINPTAGGSIIFPVSPIQKLPTKSLGIRSYNKQHVQCLTVYLPVIRQGVASKAQTLDFMEPKPNGTRMVP